MLDNSDQIFNDNNKLEVLIENNNNYNQEKLSFLKAEEKITVKEPLKATFYTVKENPCDIYYMDDTKIKKNLIMNIINFLIFSFYILLDLYLSKTFDFINQIFAYIDRIIIFMISLILLITYKRISKFARITKIIILIIQLVLGIILRILQYIKDKILLEMIIFRFFLSLFEIMIVFLIKKIIKI